MEAITKQYLDLYAAYSQELRECPQLLGHYREGAYDTFARLGLPRFKSEDYQRTDLAKLFAGDWKFLLSEGSPYWASQAFPEGIFIGALSDFIRLYPEVAKDHYGRIASAETDPLVALNTLFTAEGFVVYIPRGAKMPGHIELRSILPRPCRRIYADFVKSELVNLGRHVALTHLDLLKAQKIRLLLL